MSLTRLLPAPVQLMTLHDDNDDELEAAYYGGNQMSLASYGPPPYGHRAGWVPRRQEDFGDGGAYPEIMVAQFPLGMGREWRETSNALPVIMDAEGKIKFDSLLRQSQPKNKIIHSRFEDLVEKQVKAEDDPELARPDEEKMQEIAEKTRQALELEVNSKIAAAQPTQVAQKTAPAQYIRYTPSHGGVMFNSGAKQRVIRMVEQQKDPMEPPRFKTNTKIPRGPPSPPAPVMHSPTRKTSVKEQQEWKIPPCISNWKNPKGYTIPLDKRLAADGRGLQDPTINDKFAKLAESLYIADRKAREAVETRANLERKLAQQEQMKKETKLRELAEKARQERSGLHTASKNADEAERDAVRKDRQRERERDKRISKAGAEKKSKNIRDKDRDISEKIALGLPNTGVSQEAMYDQRLFNTNEGMDSGFGEDDSYNVYDQPWRKTDAVSSIYRPSKNIDKDLYGDDIDSLIKSSKRFTADKEFAGSDRNQVRDGPVQFEKEEEDPFQLDKFLQDAKRGGKRTDKSDKDHDKSSKRPKH
ncbi:SNW domain-containing protein 1 isoform X1 [Hydra vulgaris]|nr:SNW domain-containing protein 1 [Hydra vulgaris]